MVPKRKELEACGLLVCESGYLNENSVIQQGKEKSEDGKVVANQVFLISSDGNYLE
jgi:hypothetical protein